MKIHILIYFICLYSLQANSQTFKKYYGGKSSEYGNSISSAKDGGFVVVGSSNSTGNKQIYLLKIDSSGKEVWSSYFGGNSFEDAMSVKNTKDGGFILCGITKSFKTNYDGDVYVVKTDSLGKEEWSKLYGGEKMEIGNSVLQTTDGSYIIAGNSIKADRTQDIYLLKIDNKGNEVWNKSFSSVGTYDAKGNGVTLTLKGSIVIAGAMQTPKGYNNTLIQLGAENDTSWQCSSGGVEGNVLYSIAACSDSGFAVCGSIGGGTGNAFIMKTNKFGKKIWSKTLGIPENGEIFNAVIETKDKSIVAVGSTTGKGSGKNDVYLVKFDAKGKLLWEKYLGTPADDYGKSVIETDTGGFVIIGTSHSDPSVAEQILIYKTNSKGDFEP